MTSDSTDEVTAFAPATVANLGPGFDVLGLALRQPGDRVHARRVGGDGVILSSVTGDDGRLPRSASANTAGIAAAAVLKWAGAEAGIELALEKGLPPGSGLGSSAASAVAAAWAVNRLLGSPLSEPDLVEACLEAEAAVSGRHADNVAAAVYGGIVLVRCADPLDILQLPVPEGLTVAIASPAVEVSTKTARGALPQAFPIETVVANAGNLAALVSSLHRGDLELLSRCLDDRIATPARAEMIPGAAAVMSAATDAGALGSGLSGSGPAIFALLDGPEGAERVAEAMAAAFDEHGQSCTTWISQAGGPGARAA